MKREVSDLRGLLSGRGRRAGQHWALELEALGVLAEAVGLPRVLVLAVGSLRANGGCCRLTLGGLTLCNQLKVKPIPGATIPLDVGLQRLQIHKTGRDRDTLNRPPIT